MVYFLGFMNPTKKKYKYIYINKYVCTSRGVCVCVHNLFVVNKLQKMIQEPKLIAPRIEVFWLHTECMPPEL